MSTLTPLMKQYAHIKQQYSDALLLFQVGDFYELFYEDAKTAAAFLGIALTARGKEGDNPIPLCGVPVHALEHYLVKLVKGGFHVALCKQLEEPKPGKVVKRDVTQVLTPGTLTDAQLLDEKSSSYLLSWYPTADHWGLVFGELLTAQLFATTIPAHSMRLLQAELSRFFPDEIVMPDDKECKKIAKPIKNLGYYVSFNAYDHEHTAPVTWMREQLKTSVDVQPSTAIAQAVSCFYWYLKRTQEASLDQFKSINFYAADDYLMLDAATQRNLELIKNNQDGSRTNTLCSILDRSATPMGSRAIKKWLVRPLLKKESIQQRHDVIALFIREYGVKEQLKTIFAGIGDVERIIGRIALDRAPVNDYVALRSALQQLPAVVAALAPYNALPLCAALREQANGFHELSSMLTAALVEQAHEQQIIKDGYDQELDHMRHVINNAHMMLLDLEKKEQQRTGISSLKIRYNQVHGYYIEVTKPNLHLVPDDYIRYQTLVGKERFLNPTLKQLQQEIIQAQQEGERRELALFEHIKTAIRHQITPLRKLSFMLGYLDALLSFATVAHENHYVRPLFNEENTITIEQGRHPVIEQKLGNRFIPNDVQLHNEQRLFIITGPNMGGKSTYLRQVALICIMAQCGSFVPAQHAQVPILERIFTRIGAGDNLAEGKSTFLVEMEEAAAICSYASEQSLVILDEVGRGTSTFDGLALAQAIIEFLYQKVKARCLFATHYHELTALEKKYDGIVSYYAASKRTHTGILLLYKIVAGIADGSFGIEVARLAQLPAPIIKRADELLQRFTHEQPATFFPATTTDALEQENRQLKEKIDKLESHLKKQETKTAQLASINLDEVSPKQALDILWRLAHE